MNPGDALDGAGDGHSLGGEHRARDDERHEEHQAEGQHEPVYIEFQEGATHHNATSTSGIVRFLRSM